MNPLDSIDKGLNIVDKGIDIVGDNIEGEGKRQEQLTERLRIDNTSPFRLPNLIRPIAFIWAMSLQTILSIIALVMAFNAEPVDGDSIMAVIVSQTAILTSMVGFYFSSRKAEKIAAKKAAAEIEITKEKAKVEITRDKDKLKLASKMAEIEYKEEKQRSVIDLKEEKRESRRERRNRERNEKKEERQ